MNNFTTGFGLGLIFAIIVLGGMAIYLIWADKKHNRGLPEVKMDIDKCL